MTHQISALKSISSPQICCLIILPLLMSLVCFIVPFSWRSDNFENKLMISSQLRAVERNQDQDTNAETYMNNPIVVTIDRDIRTMGYVKSRFSVDVLNISSYICTINHDSYHDGTPSPFSGEIHIRSEIIPNASEFNVESAHLLSVTTVPLNAFKTFDASNCSTARFTEKLRHKTRVYAPLPMVGFDLPGQIGGERRWMRYNISTVIPSHDQVEALSSDGGERYTHLPRPYFMITYTLTVQNRYYALTTSLAALVLSVISAVATIYLLADECARVRGQAVSRAPAGTIASSALERRASLLLLLFLFVWQNPARALCVLVQFFRWEAVSDSLLLYASLSEALAGYGLAWCLVAYVDRLKDSGEAQPQRTEPKPPAIHNSRSAEPDTRSVSYQEGGSVQDWFREPAQPTYAQVDEPGATCTSHCSCCCCCLWDHTTLLALTWVCAGVYWLLKFPRLLGALLGLDLSRLFGGGDSRMYMLLYYAVEALLVLLSVTWIWRVLAALYSTAARLKRSRYMQCRFHQVAYVLLVTQINLGLIVFAVLLVAELRAQRFFHSGYYQCGASLHLWLWYSLRWLQYCGGLRVLISRAPLSAPYMELVLFVSALVYTTVYLTNVAAATRETPHSHPSATGLAVSLGAYQRIGETAPPTPLKSRPSFISLRRYAVTSEGPVKLNSSYQLLKHSLVEQDYSRFLKVAVPAVCIKRSAEPFCLETACLLLEAAYQTYFRLTETEQLRPATRLSVCAAPSSTNQRVASGPHLDLGRLGLRLANTFSDEQWSTFGYLAESLHQDEHRCVVAFRGSTLANIAADFKFALMALPDLRRDRKFFTEAMRAAESEVTVTEEESTMRCDSIDYSADSTDEPSSHLQSVRASGAIDATSPSLLEQARSLGSTMPLVRQGFPRIHAGFWDSYASVRDQFLAAATMAIRRHRDAYLSATQTSWPTDCARYQWAEADNHFDTDGSPAVEMVEPRAAVAVTDGGSSADKNLDLRMAFQESVALRIEITGHSLGGTMAALAALDLATNMRSIVEALCYEDYFRPDLPVGLHRLSLLWSWTAPAVSVYTFGCPRIGNTALARRLRLSAPTLYRVQVNGDLVSMVPKFAGFYRHVGVPVVVDDEESGGLIVDPSMVEQLFLRRATGSLANHSLDRYRACLEACFEPEELQEYLAREHLVASHTNCRGWEKRPSWLAGDVV